VIRQASPRAAALTGSPPGRFNLLMRVARWLTLACLLAAGCGGGEAGPGDPREITLLRDEFGVPHVFAGSPRAAAYALGWIDGEDLGVEALELAFLGTGESALRMGPGCERCAGMDLFSLAYRLPEAVGLGYERIAPDAREWLEAYAEGLTAYFGSLPSPPAAFDPADPPTGRALAMSLLAGRAAHALSELERGVAETGGSNQLAISGERTRGQATLVLKDPHNPWQRSQRYAHVSIAGFDLFGNFSLGVMGCGSNEALAFGCTRAGPVTGLRVEAALRSLDERPAEGACAAAPRYEHADHAAASGYAPLDMRCVEVSGDGVWLYESRFGPLAELGADEDGDGHPDSATFIHLFAAADVRAIDYRVRMGLARSVEEFAALFAGPTPPEDAQYRALGDSQHRVGGVLGASTPVLDPALDWARRLSSTDARIDSWTTSRDWSDLGGARWHNLDGAGPELPHVFDPAGGFFLNCNGSPRYGTLPEGQIGDVPATLERWSAPTQRDRRMLELVRDRTDLDLDALAELATDLRVPFWPELVEAIDCGLDALGLDPVQTWGDGGRMLVDLLAWRDEGYLATPESVGATLAALVEAAFPTLGYPAAGACLTREQLDAFAGAALRDSLAPYLRTTYPDRPDPLRIPWGYLNFARVAGREVGLPGMVVGRLVTLFPTSFSADPDTHRGDPDSHGGSALLQLTAYTEAGLEVRVLPPFGQVSDAVHPGSPHVGQCIDAYVRREPRRVWLEREEVEAHLCPYADEPGHEHAARAELWLP